MSIPESIIVSIFCIAVVFVVLTILCVMVKLLSFGLGSIGKKKEKIPELKSEFRAVDTAEEEKPEDDFSTGELKLVGVDEKTAAMIMAIVSHESQIPLSELCFKSIKAIEE